MMMRTPLITAVIWMGLAAASRGDADAPGKLLSQWPAGQLDACVHVVGVLQQEGSERHAHVARGMSGEMRVESTTQAQSSEQMMALRREAGNRELADRQIRLQIRGPRVA